MHRRFLLVVYVIGGVGVSMAAQDPQSALGITEGRAKEAIFDSFVSGSVSIAGKAAAFTSASPGARVAMVKFATTTARTFVESDEFARRYADHREANGPDPLPPERTAAEVLAKQRADFELEIENMRKLFDQITPEQRATLEEGWNEMRQRFTEMEQGKARQDIDAALKTQRAQLVRAHEEALKELEKVYPADPRALVAMRLRRFLEVTKDIDFSARLVDRDGKKRFADPALEAKPAEWKMSFRAGKPASDAARGFAQAWLTDLQAQGVK